jgi:hypothetical protein
MATTTLGTLVVMANRLGMRWRIDLEKDTYQASGNGYSLSCTQVPEMGLLATFTAEEKEHRGSSCTLAFNIPTDKFMCGIIPGASHLVDEDFHCTDDSGHTDVLNVVLNAIDPSNWLHQRLNLQLEEESDKDHTRWKHMFSNEITALLCELLPCEGASDHIFPGWKEGTGGFAMCPFNSPHMIRAFLSDPQIDRCAGAVATDVADQLDNFHRLAKEPRMLYAQHVFEHTTLWFAWASAATLILIKYTAQVKLARRFVSSALRREEREE